MYHSDYKQLAPNWVCFAKTAFCGEVYPPAAAPKATKAQAAWAISIRTGLGMADGQWLRVNGFWFRVHGPWL